MKGLSYAEKPMVDSFKVAVLASGSGTNLQAVIDSLQGHNGVEVVCVASDKSDAYALKRAEQAGISNAVFIASDYGSRTERDVAMADWVKTAGADLVVLAGYMQILSKEFLAEFPGAVINVHPSLLPAFKGIDAVGQALDYGVKITGVTVHFVDQGVDTGRIILQESVEVKDPVDYSLLMESVHSVEHQLLPKAIKLIASGRVSIDNDHPRRVLTSE